MDNSFITYLQQLEAIAFFSGYPLLYAVIVFIARNREQKTGIKSRLVSLLPFAYALAGTLYLGLQLKNLYPHYSFENIKLLAQTPYLQVWGLSSLLFWFPVFYKKPVLSLLHSLVFLFLLLKDLFSYLFTSLTGKEVIRNEMKIYTGSLLLNLGIFLFIAFLSFLFIKYKKNNHS